MLPRPTSSLRGTYSSTTLDNEHLQRRFGSSRSHSERSTFERARQKLHQAHSAFARLLVRRFVEDPPYLKRLRAAGVRLDYIGIALLTLGIGALQILLDKGQEDDWFGSNFIITLVIIAAVCLISLVIWEWFQKAPIIDVRMFKNFNFAMANLMIFMLGLLLFSSLVLMPQFLQTLLGYTSQLAVLRCRQEAWSCSSKWRSWAS